MNKGTLAFYSALIGTAGSMFMAGWAAHAGMWGIVAGSGLVGLFGMATLGLMAWLLIFD